MNKWLTYQKERFPILPYALMALTFAFSGIYLSSALRGAASLPSWQTLTTAFTSTLLLFMQLRIADEYKDYEDDCRFQPYRPVPRGLIKLNELGAVGIAAAVVQLVLTCALSIKLLPFLFATWIYLGLMSAEFFMRDTLRAHPLVYLFSHMPILLFVDTYITACDWVVQGDHMPPQLMLFLAVSFLNGLVIEIGRKLRAPSDEEAGVDTYTHIWGIRTSTISWLAAMGTAGIFALLTAWASGIALVMCGALAVLMGCAILLTIHFIKEPTTKWAKSMEAVSSLWVLTAYLSLGTFPAIARSIAICMH